MLLRFNDSAAYNSGQWLNNVDRIHLVLLVSTKIKNCWHFLFLTTRNLFNVCVRPLCTNCAPHASY